MSSSGHVGADLRFSCKVIPFMRELADTLPHFAAEALQTVDQVPEPTGLAGHAGIVFKGRETGKLIQVFVWLCVC